MSGCAPSNTLAPLALLTQHGKLDAVRAPLEAAGFSTFLQGGVDTDTLGTFTGEVARCGVRTVRYGNPRDARTFAALCVLRASVPASKCNYCNP